MEEQSSMTTLIKGQTKVVYTKSLWLDLCYFVKPLVRYKICCQMCTYRSFVS